MPQQSDAFEQAVPVDHSLVEYETRNTALSTQVKVPVLDDEDLVDVGRIWRVLRRHIKLISTFGLVGGVLAFAFARFFLLPEYTAVAKIEYLTPALDNKNLTGGSINFTPWEDRNTIIEVLASRSVARQTLIDSGLINHPEYLGDLTQRRLHLNPLSVFKRNSKTKPQDVGAIVQRASNYAASRVDVELLKGTDIFEVKFRSLSQTNAASFLNQLPESYNAIEESKVNQTSQKVLEKLNLELQNVQRQLVTSERKLTQFARRTGISNLDDESNTFVRQNALTQDEYFATQKERVKLELLLNSIRNTRKKADVSNLLEDSAEISSLKNQLIEARAKRNELSQIYLSAHPEIQAINSQIAQINRSIANEVDREKSRITARYEYLVNSEKELEKDVARNNETLLNLQDRSVAYNILKREWESTKKLHEGLLEQVKSAGAVSSLQTNSLTLAEAALRPSSPSSPNTSKWAALGGFTGLSLGMMFAFIIAIRDRNFHSIKEIEDFAGYPVISVLPKLTTEELEGLGRSQGNDKDAWDKHRSDIFRDEPVNSASKFVERGEVAFISHFFPGSSYGEAFRSLRTNLMFSTPGQSKQVVMITSTSPAEAKTSSTVNLATTYARNGLSTVIVDFDLRKPSLHKVFGRERNPGVTDGLVNKTAHVGSTTIENLSIVTAGTKTINPTEMIESDACRRLVTGLKNKFDAVLLDAPPIMGLADSLILSQYADLLVVAVDIQKTNKDALKSAMNRLKRVNAPTVGVMVTKYETQKHDDYGYGGYYYYDYKYDYKYAEDDD